MFFKPKEKPGLLAIVPRKQRMEFAHVIRAGDKKPTVTLLESTSRAGNSDTEALLRARKALHLQGYRCTTWIEPASIGLTTFQWPFCSVRKRKPWVCS